MKKKVSLIGGSGFLGINLAKELHRRGFDIIIYDLLKPKKLKFKYKFEKGNVLNLKNLINKTKGSNYLINLSGVADISYSSKNYIETIDYDYNQKVIILVEAIIIELEGFDININRNTIRQTILDLPITTWATTILSNSANFISKFLLVIIITLFLLLGNPKKNTSDEWNDIIGLVKKYIFTKFLTSAFTGICAGIIYHS